MARQTKELTGRCPVIQQWHDAGETSLGRARPRKCEPRGELVAARMRMTRHVEVAWRRRNCTRIKDEGRIWRLRGRVRTLQEGRKGIKNVGGRWPLCQKKKEPTKNVIGGYIPGQ